MYNDVLLLKIDHTKLSTQIAISGLYIDKKRYDTWCHINRLDLDWLMFLFLISNCLIVIEVLVNFGTEPGPACWEVCHCEG